MSYDPEAEIDDSMAANFEEPRVDTGYRAPAPPAIPPGRGVCRDCRAGEDTLRAPVAWERGVPLYCRPRATGESAAHRVVCATCVGKINREHTERITDAVRALKAASVMGNGDDERAAHKQLATLAGAEAADGCAAALRNAASEKPAKGGRR